MRRFTFYTFVALLTFGVGSFIAFNFFWKTQTASPKPEQKPQPEISDQTRSSETFSVDMTKSPVYENTSKDDERKKPFCKDKRILPVWNLIKKDDYFQRQSGGTFFKPNCSDMFEILNFDLNKDGNKEIILRGKSSDLCGAVGNCGFWIFEKKGKRYRKILSASDYVDITEMGEQITRRKTKGYFDILLKGHWSASDTGYYTYKFNGQKYTKNKCLVEACVICTGDNPKWKFMSCREYEKRNSN